MVDAAVVLFGIVGDGDRTGAATDGMLLLLLFGMTSSGAGISTFLEETTGDGDFMELLVGMVVWDGDLMVVAGDGDFIGSGGLGDTSGVEEPEVVAEEEGLSLKILARGLDAAADAPEGVGVFPMDVVGDAVIMGWAFGPAVGVAAGAGGAAPLAGG